MKNGSLTPVKLRIALGVVLVLLIGAAVGVFMLGLAQLQKYSAEAQETANKAQLSQSSLNELVNTKKVLDDNADSVNRAEQLVSQSKSYVYQDQIINDINKYATEAGLSITNISFNDASSSNTSSAVANGAGSATTPGTSATGSAPAPNGLKSMTATVTLKNPADYNGVLNFIHLIEQSLFRMQLSKVSLSRNGDKEASSQVNSDALTIEVFVR